MPKLKMLPLDWWQKPPHFDKDDPEDLTYHNLEELPKSDLIGVDGRFCLGKKVWFEVDGKGFKRVNSSIDESKFFNYELTANSERILREDEALLTRKLLDITSDSKLKKILRARLEAHDAAIQTRRSTIESFKIQRRLKNK